MSTFPPYLEQTAEQYKINEWVAKVAEREKKYFRGIDIFKTLVKEVTSLDPGDEMIIKHLMTVLEIDRTFAGHIKKWKGSSSLTEEKFWVQLYMAAAYVLLMAYTEDCERNKWPEQP
jgi:hypothetical protein